MAESGRLSPLFGSPLKGVGNQNPDSEMIEGAIRGLNVKPERRKMCVDNEQ